MNRYELLKQIAILDFAAIDLHLYLNTHPMDKEAIAQYNSFVMQNKMLRQNYEKYYGALTMNECSAYPWNWIDEPWPWEYEANYRL